MAITYSKFFRIMNCDTIIFLEDDFRFRNSKESLFYGLARLNLDIRERLYNELMGAGADFVNELQEYSNIMSTYIEAIDWENEIPRDDIETLFLNIEGVGQDGGHIGAKLREIYEKIDVDDMVKFGLILNQYGLGVQIPTYFEKIFNDYIYKDGEWKKYKIYTNFNSKTKDSFTRDLNEHSQQNKTIICIIDNQLEEEQRASEILQRIEQINGSSRKNIVTAILSSKEKEEKISSNVFAEYVSKGARDTRAVEDGLQIALAKSAYSLLLFKLKSVYQKILEEAFDRAIENKDIAFYFAKMASTEGVTNYKVVTDWLNLLFQYNSTFPPVKQVEVLENSSK